MRNIVNANEFLKAMNKVNKATTKKILPILEEIKVDFTDNKCTLTGTNLNQFIIAEIAAQGDSFSFVFKDTKSIIKASKYFTDDLEFIYNTDGNVTLNSNKKSCKQVTISVDEYPITPAIEFDDIYNIKSDTLINRYNKIKYAISKEETKPILTGVCFREDKIIALDGYRLAINTDENLMVNREFIIPQEAMKLLNIYDKNTSLQMKVNHKQVLFTDGKITLITRLLEGEYIKTQDIIPQDSKEEYDINIKQYVNELKYLNEFTDKIKPYIKFEKGSLTSKNENGEYSSNVDFGKDSNIMYGFNCDYMLEALNQFKDVDKVSYKLNSSVAPILITNENDLALVLPVRLAS